MFGIGLPEFLVILAVAIVVIGPKDLPRALYSAGKLARKIKAFMGDVQSSLDHVMKEGEMDDIIEQANKPGGADLQQKIERQIQAEEENKKGPADG